MRRLAIDKFKEALGKDSEAILEYCLGKNFKNMTIHSSMQLFNEKLSLNIEPGDNLVESAVLIRNAYLKQVF